tara:strand:- start:226 stop:669 length:444 start_codon:yes stop_codon:yes gene_type:complete
MMNTRTNASPAPSALVLSLAKRLLDACDEGREQLAMFADPDLASRDIYEAARTAAILRDPMKWAADCAEMSREAAERGNPHNCEPGCCLFPMTDDEEATKSERANLAGMEHGMDARNEAMGWDTSAPEPCGHHCWDKFPRCHCMLEW